MTTCMFVNSKLEAKASLLGICAAVSQGGRPSGHVSGAMGEATSSGVLLSEYLSMV